MILLFSALITLLKNLDAHVVKGNIEDWILTHLDDDSISIDQENLDQI